MTEQVTIFNDQQTGLSFAADIGEVTPVSWQPPTSLTFEEWTAIGNTLQQVGASLNWWIGDWLNYGEGKWGEMYAQALEITGWEYGRLADAKYVAAAVQFSLRNENLSWTHHRHVASLPPAEQAEWLNNAAANGWRSGQLKDAIKASKLPPTIAIPLNLHTNGNGYHAAPSDDPADVDDVPFGTLREVQEETEELDRAEFMRTERTLRLAAANHVVSDDPNYDGDEWYTPAEYIEAARELMGGIDLDPASCEAAQETVKAEIFYTKQDNGLTMPWFGCVWLNPPYSTPLIRYFVAKLIEEYEAGNITEAVILTNNSSDTAWFHDLLGRYPACFPRGRVQFWRPDHADFGARQGQTLFYLGENVQAFKRIFGRFGQVVGRL